MNDESTLQAEVVRLYVEERHGLDKVARLTSTTRRTALRLLAAAGVSLRPKSTALDPDRIIARYRDGEGLVSIAVDEHCNPNRVRAILIAAGVSIRAVGRNLLPDGSPIERSDCAPLDAASIIARYTAGESLGAIATADGCHVRRVREVLLAAGVTIRPRGWSVGRPRRQESSSEKRPVGRPRKDPSVPTPSAEPVARTCHLCDTRIYLLQWHEHRYTVHGIETAASKRERRTDAAIASQAQETPREPQAPVRCPACRCAPCQTITACGRKLRALAQHAGRNAA